MSEDQDPDSKTEQPTDKRLRDAREKGQVAKSQEVGHLFIVGTSLALLTLMLPWIMERIGATLVPFLERADQFPTDPAAIGRLLTGVLAEVGIAMAFPLLLLVVAALAATFVQVGFLFSTEQVFKLNLNKLNPLKQLQHKFSLRNLVEFLKSLLKLTIVGVVVTVLLLPLWGSVEHIVSLPLEAVVAKTIDYAARILFAVLLVILLLAGLDYMYQRFEFMKQMRMSRQDVKDEYKQTEGDPTVKARIRQLRMQRARSRMMANVPKADVIVTNPTHFAVALGYDPASNAAPVVLAKGADLIAAKIREIAEENRIPIVSNPPLARALYATAEIDEEIPTEHYQAVAQVISYVYKLKRKPLPN